MAESAAVRGEIEETVGVEEQHGGEQQQENQRKEVPQGRVAAVVPAAGCGERMGGDTPKQYLTVCGAPLVTHCLVALEEVPWMSRVVVVADDPDRMKRVVANAALTKVTVVQGEGSRHRSILAGVDALAADSDPPDVVVVHDGVRPLLPYTTLAKVAVSAERHGAAGVVRPLVSTVVRPDSEDFLRDSLVRRQYRNSEMPQAFRFTVLRDAYRRCSVEELAHGTECLALALNIGIRAKLVPGPPLLWKVTEDKDLVVARSVLPRHVRRVAVFCRALPPSTEPPTEENQGPSAKKNMVESVHSEEDYSSTALMCSKECVQVFHSIDASLRRNCKRLDVFSSYNFNYSTLSSVAIVMIAKLDSISTLQSHLDGIARAINRCVCKLIMIFTMRLESDISVAGISQLQQCVKRAFTEHSGHVTVILVPVNQTPQHLSPDTSRHKIKPKHEAQKGSSGEEGEIEGRTQVSPLPCADQLSGLVTSLLDQSSECFHGQVLVL